MEATNRRIRVVRDGTSARSDQAETTSTSRYPLDAHPQRLRQLFDALRGRKHLILDNHDNGATKSLPWASINERLVVTVDGQRCLLDYYPVRSWAGSNRGTIQLCGHVHGRLPDLWNAADVCIDRWSYMPVDLLSILARLAEIPRPTCDADDESGDEPSGLKL